MPNIGYLNGEFMPLEEVRISPEDRGFQFGDGVYEVIRTYQGKPFFLPEHLCRLEQSARALSISLSVDPSKWKGLILEGIRQSAFKESKIYIQVTRGKAPRMHPFPAQSRPTIFMSFREMPDFDETMRVQGVAAVTVPDLRWGRCDIKSLNLLPNVLAQQQAREAGAFEAIFVKEEIVTEGAVSNVMVVRNGDISTPPVGHQILSGVTRLIVLDLARKAGLEIQERVVKVSELGDIEELFLVGTTIEILPVTRLDEKPIGSGLPGLVTTSLMTKFSEMVVSYCQGSSSPS